MYRIFLQIGPLNITSYGVMAALGAIAALFVFRKFRSIARMTDDHCYDLLLYGMIAGIVGARLFYVIQFWDKFKNNLFEIVMIHHGGLVFYGGFIMAFIAIFIFSRRNKLDFVRVLDLCAPALPIAHFFGRIGCFLNGCCFGKRTDSVFGVVFPKGSDPFAFYGGAVKLHPTQLYEALGNIIIFLLIFNLIKGLKRGQSASLYLILYASLRFFVEFFRGDHKNFIFGFLTPAQFIGAIVLPIGIAAFIFFAKNEEKDSNA